MCLKTASRGFSGKSFLTKGKIYQEKIICGKARVRNDFGNYISRHTIAQYLKIFKFGKKI